MTDLRTLSPDELPRLSAIPDDALALVFSPNGPLQALPYEKLLTKLIATNLVKPTKAALDADLAHPADSVALVFDDPTPALNGWYRKLGASGAGSWNQFEELSRSVRAAAAASAEAAAASAAVAAASVASLTIGALMEDILALPLLPDLEGSEFVAVVKDGVTYRTTMAALSDYLGSGPSVPAPSFTVQPSITGAATVGAVLTGNVGTIANGSAVLLAWLRGGAPIGGADGTTYTVSEDDLGELISFRVEAGGAGGSAIATSATIGPVTTQASITGIRLAVVGDSRQDNGMSSQAGGGTGRTTGVPAATRAQSIPASFIRRLGHPMDIIGQWTLGGNKSSQNYHDHALAIIAARNPDAIFLLDSTNDPIDYTANPGLAPVTRGLVTPALARFLPRVGDREPVNPGTGQQGTTFGNIVKAFEFWGDPVANGLGRVVPVIFAPIPTAQPSRQVLNRLAYEFGLAAEASGLFPHVIFPRAYPAMLTDPNMVNGPVASEVIRSDLKGDGTQGADGESLFLHPTEAEADWIGKAIAEDSRIVAAFDGRPSLFLAATGSNNGAFVNANPKMAMGAGNGTTFGSGAAPTGTIAQNWQLGHDVVNGAISVVASFDGSAKQTITITRTGGTESAVSRTVELRSDTWTVAPVAGETFTLNAEYDLPARAALDVFAVEAFLEVNAPGMVDERGQSLALVNYGAMMSNEPNPIAPGARTLQLRSVPVEFTPAMLASVTGAITMRVRFRIRFRDNLNTDTNGALVLKFGQGGVEKRTRTRAHIVPPEVPTAGPACSAAPSISGNAFVGSILTLNDGTFASGAITARRLLRNGVAVAYTGNTYTLTEDDLGAYFYFENKAGTGGAITTAMSQSIGPVETPSAELAALIAAVSGQANNAIFDNRRAFTGVPTINDWRVPDLSGNNNVGAQTFATRHPGIDGTLGATFDGGNDAYGYSWQGGAPATITVVMRLRKTAGVGGKRLLSDGTTTAANSAGAYTSGGTTALTGTWTVDGAAVTTQGQLYSALDDGADHVVMVTGLPVSGWAAMFISRITAGHDGSIAKVVVINETTGSLSAARTASVAWAQTA